MKFGTSEGMVVAAGPGDKDVFLLLPDDGASRDNACTDSRASAVDADDDLDEWRAAPRAILLVMSALKAHVVNGQIILDEPAEPAEGAELLVLPVGGEMSDDERVELERAIEEGIEDFERGDFEDAREFGLRLLAKQ